MMQFFKKAPLRSNPIITPFGALAAILHRMFPALGRRVALGGALEHLASLPLTAQSSLALVRLHHETLLLGITPQSITLLSKDQEAQSGSSRRIADAPVGLHSDDGSMELADR